VVVVRIDGSWGRHFDAWLSRLPAAALVLAGLVIVAGLGWMDFVTGPELTPLVFYLVPVVLVAWYAGRWPGAIVACAGGLAWMLADALTQSEYSHWSIPYWNVVLRLAALLLVSEAVARLRLAHARERELARRDALTGAPNARAFYELAGAEIARARRYIHPFSVAYLDLDDFKVVNDRLGHLAGDAVLRSVARALGGVLRASDVVARLGGDEFVVLLPEAGAAPARLATDKLRQALAEVVPAHGWRMTASIGVATFLVAPESVDELLAAVDGLMYRAKQSGKNGVAHETRNEAPAVR
jgi:diguanylate cyclase (GGDEF)-like protein